MTPLNIRSYPLKITVIFAIILQLNAIMHIVNTYCSNEHIEVNSSYLSYYVIILM